MELRRTSDDEEVLRSVTLPLGPCPSEGDGEACCTSIRPGGEEERAWPRSAASEFGAGDLARTVEEEVDIFSKYGAEAERR